VSAIDMKDTALEDLTVWRFVASLGNVPGSIWHRDGRPVYYRADRHPYYAATEGQRYIASDGDYYVTGGCWVREEAGDV
jgi:hypothetical protein